MNDIYFILSICSVAYLISSNKISHGLRDWFWKHSTVPYFNEVGIQDYKVENKKYYFIYQLITCPYCLAFWISLIITLNIEKALSIAIVSLIINTFRER